MTEEIYEQNEFIPTITYQICVRNIASVSSSQCISVTTLKWICQTETKFRPINANRNGQTDGWIHIRSVAPDKVQSLRKHSLTNKSISRNACVARESYIISENVERKNIHTPNTAC